MNFKKNVHTTTRRSVRLKGYDYRLPSAYYITICTHGRRYLFGEVVDGKMILNNIGQHVEKCWLAIPEHFPHTILHEYIVLPNHVHEIIEITVGANHHLPVHKPSPDHQEQSEENVRRWWAKHFSPLRGTSKTIGSVVRGFKIGVTKYIRQHTDIYNVWQRNYYEHIIRDSDDFHRIAKYIQDNPMNWQQDEMNTSK